MAFPSAAELHDKLTASLKVAIPLATESQPKWEANCEGAFSDLRLRIVHMRRNTDTLNTIEDKGGAWKFLSRFSQTRPFMSDRCIEVLKILMKSEEWMKAYAADPTLNMGNLPKDIMDELHKHVKEVVPEFVPEATAGGEDDPNGPGGEGDAVSGTGAAGRRNFDGITFMRPTNIALVVQRCLSAKISAKPEEGIPRGLVVFVSFSKGANEAAILNNAVRFLLTAKLSTRGDAPPAGGKKSPASKPAATSNDPESLALLCRQGDPQGILVLPQESLSSDLSEDKAGISYGNVPARREAEAMLAKFVAALKTMSVELVGKKDGKVDLKVASGTYGGNQNLELSSAGPFIHACHF